MTSHDLSGSAPRREPPDASARPWQVIAAALFVLVLAAVLGTPLLSVNRDDERHGSEVFGDSDAAVVFAVRALAAADLLDPNGNFMQFTERVEPTNEGWKVGFAALRCGSIDEVDTCRSTDGGSSTSTDVWLHVGTIGDSWRVLTTEGDLPEGTSVLQGWSRPVEGERPHWEFPSVSVGPARDEGDDGRLITATALWVGPIPHEGPGSVCRVVAFGADGDVVHRGDALYQTPPRAGWGRMGTMLGTEVDAPARSAEVRCAPFLHDFEPIGEPRLSVEAGPERVVIGTAELRWSGPKIDATSFWCDVSLFDRNGSLVRKSVAGPNPAFFPPQAFEGPPPYKQPVHFLFRLKDDAPVPVEADLDCSINPPLE